MEELAAQARIVRALGEAVVTNWSTLPQHVQHRLFEDAVGSQGEQSRQILAVFLHERHSRTADAPDDRMVPEPDSKGG